jgi:hypothetical protein
MLSDLFVLFALAVILSIWWRGQGVREIALKAVEAHCQEMNVQWLDQHVALRGFWLKRNTKGRLCGWRAYKFEFSSTGDERYEGRVVLLGREVESIQLQAHRLH